MKNLVSLLAVATMILVQMSFAWGQSEGGRSTVRVEGETSQRPRFLDRATFFLNAYPVPLASGGMGGAIEIEALSFLTIWLGLERDTEEDTFNFFGQSDKTTYDNRFVGARLYQNGNFASGFYLNAGYKWTEMTSEYSPALFQGVSVEKEERTSGVYGGLGYRFLISDTYSVTWVLDIGVNYEPGYVKERRYVAKNEGWFGPTEAELETDIQYSVFPELRFGCNF